MKPKTFAILSTAFTLTLIGATAAFPHVLDFEFVSPPDRYAVDPDRDGRDFYDWVNDQSRREEARDQWIKDVVSEVAFEVAASFDPRLSEKD